MKYSAKKELFVETEGNENKITVTIQDTGHNTLNTSEKFGISEDNQTNNFNFVKILLKKYKVECIFEEMKDVNSITLIIPLNMDKINART
jgi:hypothetical protein